MLVSCRARTFNFLNFPISSDKCPDNLQDSIAKNFNLVEIQREKTSKIWEMVVFQFKPTVWITIKLQSLPNDGGMIPPNLFWERSNILMELRFPNKSGMKPWKSFEPRERNSRWLFLNNQFGIEESKWLYDKTRWLIKVEFPRSLRIGPRNSNQENPSDEDWKSN